MADADLWRRVARIAGLTRADDLPFVFLPLLWAAWLATAGHPDPWRLAALFMAVGLARSAAWSGFLPELARLGEVWRARRFLLLVFGAGALCFALPLGMAGWLVPLALALAAGWFRIRRHSYLSDPLLAFALMLLSLAAWLAAGGVVNKSTGLLLLAAACWSLSALAATPIQQGVANLALLMEGHGRAGAAALRLAALVALWLAGRQSKLGLLFLVGLGIALALDLARWALAERGRRVAPWLWEAGWGAVVWVALVVQLSLAGVGEPVT